MRHDPRKPEDEPIELTARESAALLASAAALTTYPDATPSARAQFPTLERAAEKIARGLEREWTDTKAMFGAEWATSENAQLREACVTAERAIAIWIRAHPCNCKCLVCSIALPALREVLPQEQWTSTEPDERDG